MNLTISPEHENILRRIASERGFASPEAFLQDEVGGLLEQEIYILENRDEIREMIEEGWQDLERGDSVSSEDAKRQIAAWKQEALAKRNAA